MSKSFITRLLSGIVLVLLTFVFNYYGGILLLLETFFISYIGMLEFYRVVGVCDKVFLKEPIVVASVIMTVIYYVTSYLLGVLSGFLIFIIAIIVMLAIYVFTFPRYQSSQIAYAIMGFVYVPVMVSFLYFSRATKQGLYLVWLVYLTSWCCDIGAYVVGVLIGKHKMAPVLSPKKSVEGAIGGVLFAALCGYLYALYLSIFVGFDPSYQIKFAIICGIGGFVSQVGDLCASAVKRNHDIKDYGKLIPGHGGILDRYDSVIFTAPMVFILILIMDAIG